MARTLKLLQSLLGAKQFNFHRGHNAWILKPGGKSRGRGIEIFTSITELEQTIKESRDCLWVTQKYIERPLLVIGKKFDIRVWVLLTSVEPLRIWLF